MTRISHEGVCISFSFFLFVSFFLFSCVVVSVSSFVHADNEIVPRARSCSCRVVIFSWL